MSEQTPPPAGPPSPGPAPTDPLSPSDERMWAMFAHLSGIVVAIIAPLIIMLTMGNRSAYVRKQAVEALNFQITLMIAVFVCILLTFVVVGVFLLPIVGIGGLVLMIIAGVKTYGGEDYRYPVNIRMVK